jgi:hypothetical protein
MSGGHGRYFEIESETEANVRPVPADTARYVAPAVC